MAFASALEFPIYAGLVHFSEFKILNFNILEIFQKTEYFCGRKILYIFFRAGGHQKVDYFWGSFLYVLGSE